MLKKFSLLLMFFSYAQAEITYTNVNLVPESYSYKTNKCEDVENSIRARTESSELELSYLPIFLTIKENIKKHNFQNQLGESCEEITYDAVGFTAAENTTPLYQRYSAQLQTIDLLSGQIEDKDVQKTDLEKDYDDLVLITEKLALDWAKLQEDYPVLEDEVKIYRVERDSLLAEEIDLQQKLISNADLIAERDSLKEEKVSTNQLLIDKILELEATKTQYSSYESTIDIETMLDAGLNTGTYNLVEALNDYIEAHQNDIRTSRTIDNTLMDLNYMQMNFLQTRTIR